MSHSETWTVEVFMSCSHFHLSFSCLLLKLAGVRGERLTDLFFCFSHFFLLSFTTCLFSLKIAGDLDSGISESEFRHFSLFFFSIQLLSYLSFRFLRHHYHHDYHLHHPT